MLPRSCAGRGQDRGRRKWLIRTACAKRGGGGSKQHTTHAQAFVTEACAAHTSWAVDEGRTAHLGWRLPTLLPGPHRAWVMAPAGRQALTARRCWPPVHVRAAASLPPFLRVVRRAATRLLALAGHVQQQLLSGRGCAKQASTHPPPRTPVAPSRFMPPDVRCCALKPPAPPPVPPSMLPPMLPRLKPPPPMLLLPLLARGADGKPLPPAAVTWPCTASTASRCATRCCSS